MGGGGGGTASGLGGGGGGTASGAASVGVGAGGTLGVVTCIGPGGAGRLVPGSGGRSFSKWLAGMVFRRRDRLGSGVSSGALSRPAAVSVDLDVDLAAPLGGVFSSGTGVGTAGAGVGGASVETPTVFRSLGASVSRPSVRRCDTGVIGCVLPGRGAGALPGNVGDSSGGGAGIGVVSARDDGPGGAAEGGTGVVGVPPGAVGTLPRGAGIVFDEPREIEAADGIVGVAPDGAGEVEVEVGGRVGAELEYIGGAPLLSTPCGGPGAGVVGVGPGLGGAVLPIVALFDSGGSVLPTGSICPVANAGARPSTGNPAPDGICVGMRLGLLVSSSSNIDILGDDAACSVAARRDPTRMKRSRRNSTSRRKSSIVPLFSMM